MSAKSYTVEEINSMRRVLQMDYPSGPYYPEERNRGIEDQLRTYIAAGVDPQEVIKSYTNRMIARQQADIRRQESKS